MAENDNTDDKNTARLQITVHSKLTEYLNQAVNTGLYGTSDKNAASIILSKAIRKMIKKGDLKEIP